MKIILVLLEVSKKYFQEKKIITYSSERKKVELQYMRAEQQNKKFSFRCDVVVMVLRIFHSIQIFFGCYGKFFLRREGGGNTNGKFPRTILESWDLNHRSKSESDSSRYL